MDTPDSFLSSTPISHISWQVLYMASSVHINWLFFKSKFGISTIWWKIKKKTLKKQNKTKKISEKALYCHFSSFHICWNNRVRIRLKTSFPCFLLWNKDGFSQEKHLHILTRTHPYTSASPKYQNEKNIFLRLLQEFFSQQQCSFLYIHQNQWNNF